MQTLDARRGGRKAPERPQDMGLHHSYPAWVKVSIWVVGFAAPWIIIFAIWFWR
jgi:hypothetical protein